MSCKVNGIWCNGNTTDSGPVIPGSNPGIPTTREKETKESFEKIGALFLYIGLCKIYIPLKKSYTDKNQVSSVCYSK